MGILSTAAGGIPADSHLVGGQREETGHARTTAGSIDCRIRQRAQAWTGERLEQEIGFTTPCRRSPVSTGSRGLWDTAPLGLMKERDSASRSSLASAEIVG